MKLGVANYRWAVSINLDKESRVEKGNRLLIRQSTKGLFGMNQRVDIRVTGGADKRKRPDNLS